MEEQPIVLSPSSIDGSGCSVLTLASSLDKFDCITDLVVTRNERRGETPPYVPTRSASWQTAPLGDGERRIAFPYPTTTRRLVRLMHIKSSLLPLVWLLSFAHDTQKQSRHTAGAGTVSGTVQTGLSADGSHRTMAVVRFARF